MSVNIALIVALAVDLEKLVQIDSNGVYCYVA
jgi:hypothetical protein